MVTMYRCLVCQNMFHMEHILDHMLTHDTVYPRWTTLPSTVEEYLHKFAPVGCDLIEVVEE